MKAAYAELMTYIQEKGYETGGVTCKYSLNNPGEVRMESFKTWIVFPRKPF